MLFVIRINAFDGCNDLLHRRKAEQALAGRQEIAKSSLLGDDRLARRQVLGAPFTKPTTAQAYVLVFGDREFTARSRDVLPIAVDITRKTEGVPYLPALALQQFLIVFLVTAQSQLERLARTMG